MAIDFKDLKRKKRHDDGNEGKGRFRDKNEEWDEILNPFRSAKKESYDESTDTVPVEDEGTAIEEMVEGEAGHTAEEKMGEGDHDYSEDEPLPAFLEKEEYEEEEGEEEEEEEGKKKKGPGKKKDLDFSFRRYL